MSRPSSHLFSNATSRLAQLSNHIQSHSSISAIPSSISRTIQKSIAGQSRMAHTTFKLNTGASIPAVGFGTWQDKEAQEGAVVTALKAGYKHIDTAIIYGTEDAVGKGVKSSGVPRSEIFLTTKLWNNAHHPDDVEKQLDTSLKNLGTDYVDLYLMHWPAAFARSDEFFPKDKDGNNETADIDYLDTWKGMEKCVKSGKAKAIGVSNFSHAELDRLTKNCEIMPAAHQLELHPYLQQKAFVDFHKQKGIHVTHYSPFGNQNAIYSKGENMGKLMDDPVLVEIGKKYNKTGAQVALAWGIAQGHSVIPKSKTEHRIKSNLDCEFKLSDEDVQKISSIDKKMRFNDPSKGFRYTFYADLDGKE